VAGKLLDNNELEGIWQESVVAFHLIGEGKKNVRTNSEQ
jgi:hypothetical protein